MVRAGQGTLHAVQTAQQLEIALPHSILAIDGRVQNLKLGQAQGRLDIAHAHVPAKPLMDEPLGAEAQVPVRPAALGKGGIVGRHHAAFARGHVLVGVETEGADVAETSTRPALVGQSDRFRRVLDDFQAVGGGHIQDRVHIHRQAVDVHHHDGLRPGCAFGGDLRRIHVPGVGVAVHQDRRGAGPDHRQGAGNYGEGRQNDLVARTDIEGGDGQFQRGRAVGDGNAVGAAGGGREPLFELANERPGRRYPAGVDTRVHVFPFVAGEKRLVHRDEIRHCRDLELRRVGRGLDAMRFAETPGAGGHRCSQGPRGQPVIFREAGRAGPKRIFSSSPRYGPVLTSMMSTSSRTSKPCPPETSRMVSPCSRIRLSRYVSSSS